MFLLKANIRLLCPAPKTEEKKNKTQKKPEKYPLHPAIKLHIM